MTTTTTDYRATAVERMTPTLDRLSRYNTDFGMQQLRRARAALEAPASGTLKAWLQARDGRQVTTIQVHNGNGTAWTPTGRTVKAYATYVELSGSRRDFAGMRVVGVTDEAIVALDDWHTVAFVVEGDAHVHTGFECGAL